MKIEFERSGGFAGMTVKCRIDTDKLSGSESKRLIELVEKSALLSRGGAKAKTGKSLPDSFLYNVKIADQGRAFAGVISESDASESEQSLFSYLVELARRG